MALIPQGVRQPEKKKNRENLSITHFQVECSRINNVLSEIIGRLQYVLCIPLLVENNCELFSRFFNESQMRKIRSTFGSYTFSLEDQKVECHASPFFVSSTNSLECIFNKYIFKTTLEGVRNNPELAVLIDITLRNEEIKQLCDQSLISKLPAHASDFLNSLNQLKYYIIKKIQLTPAQAERKQIELSTLFRENENAKKELNHLKNDVKEQEKKNSEMVDKLNDKIKAVKHKMDDILDYCNDNIIKNKQEAEKKMEWERKISEYKLEKLSETEKKLEVAFETQHRSYLSTEKTQRVKRGKVITQLMSCLARYDADMADRHTQLENLKIEFSMEQNILADLQGKFNLQSEEYEILMAEKEEFEANERKIVLERVNSSIAARKIQRYFRYYVDFLAAHGIFLTKKKKGKGKKK